MRILYVTALAVLTSGVRAQFNAEFQYFVQGPSTMDLRDMDGDGRPDLLLTTRQGMVVHPNTAVDGLFGPQVILANGEVLSWAADVDNDGLPEIFGSVPDQPGLRMYRNNGGMHFTQEALLSETITPTDMVAADMDLDGDVDVAFTTTTGAVVVFYNTSSIGTFSTAYTVAQLNGVQAPQVADIDHDGWPDLVFSSPSMGQVRTCLNQLGTFDSATQLSAQGRAVARDLDSDGKADLLVAGSSTVAWRRNLAPLGLLSTPTALQGSFPAASLITTADIDNDGDLDAIVASATTGDIAWYENLNGQGIFGEPQVIAIDMPGVSSIVASDADGDGDLDLFVASTYLDKVYWFANMINSTGTLTGRVFNDLNGDGVFNGNDHGLSNIRVEASDMGATYTNASGMYWYEAVPSPYLVWLPPVAGWSLTTPGSYMVEVPEVGASNGNDFGLMANAPVTDLQVSLTSQPTRCNEQIQYWITVYNNGNTACDLQLDLTLNPTSTFIAATLPTSEHGTSTAQWILNSVQPYQERNIHVTVLMPSGDQMGASLSDQLHVTATANGQVLDQVDVAHDFVLACSMDPNDKLVVPVGTGVEHTTPMGSEFFYTVRFQNTGNDTAHDVYILDTLDTSLDPGTFKLRGMSHVGHTLLQPDGVLRFTFNNIMLPDSGSNMLASQGYVSYTIRHRNGRAEGTRVENTAAIFFDMNEPVITNTTFNTLRSPSSGVADAGDGPKDQLTLFPNPAHTTVTLRFDEVPQGRVWVELIDATGRMVRDLVRRSNTVVMDVDGLPAGLYIVRTYEEGSGLVRTARLVVE